MANTSALGQYLGYTLQTWRMLSYLLKSKPGVVVSLEHFDDVCILDVNGLILEQDKSSTSSNNPVSNSSLDLWKTFYNWIVLVENGSIDIENTKLILYTRNYYEGDIISLFNDANNNTSAAIAVEKSKLITQNIQNEKTKKYIKKFNDTDIKYTSMLVNNFTYLYGTGDLNEEIRYEISNLIGVPPEYSTEIRRNLLGWLNEKIIKKIESLGRVSVKFEDFKKEVDSIVRKLDRKTILASLVDECNEEELGNYKDSVFVQQLNLINYKENEIIKAALYKRRAEDNVIKWSEAGLVHESSYIEFNKALESAWHNHHGIEKIINKTIKEEELGQLILLRCTSEKLKLQGMDTDYYFIPGSYHQLSDSLSIGWHPRFKELIGHKNEK